MAPTKRTIFLELELIRCRPFVFGRCIIPPLAFHTCKRDNNSHPPTPSFLLRYQNPVPCTELKWKLEVTDVSLCFLRLTGASKPPATRLEVYSITSLTTPAPTVRPPSRIANRSSFSIAIGVISSADIVTLSPGITISTPSGKFKMPVTSVVRK